jgi:NAD(P)-dependent dehydrogenase (short-subunit alcohol dehydrogenase family)
LAERNDGAVKGTESWSAVGGVKLAICRDARRLDQAGEDMKLTGHTALVTGGAGDLGGAMAYELASSGANVVIWDVRSSEQTSRTLNRVRSTGGNILYRQVDVTNREAVDSALSDFDNLDPLSIVCVNAGIVISAPFLSITQDQWQQHLDVNLNGAFNTAQATAKIMVKNKTPGRIIFTSSWVANVPWPEITAYTVSKAGMNMLMRQMAKELAPYGIRVNAVAPGIVKAGLAGKQLQNDPRYAARVSKVIPLGIPGNPEDVAKAVIYLAGPDTAYMTGSVLTLDGGCSLFQFDNS